MQTKIAVMIVFCTVLLIIGVFRVINATPACPIQTVSSEIRIDGEEILDRMINTLSDAPYECVTLTLVNNEIQYKINFVELFKIKTNFVMVGLGQQQVELYCTGSSNDTESPLSGLMYVGFRRLAFYGCNVPLWIENVATVEMEEVTFRLVIDIVRYRHDISSKKALISTNFINCLVFILELC